MQRAPRPWRGRGTKRTAQPIQKTGGAAPLMRPVFPRLFLQGKGSGQGLLDSRTFAGQDSVLARQSDGEKWWPPDRDRGLSVGSTTRELGRVIVPDQEC